MKLIANLILLLATFIARSYGYNFIPQFQSKFRKCVACTVIISSIGTSIPLISSANELLQGSTAPATTAKIRAFKAFTKEDLELEEKVKIAEKEAEEDTKVYYDILCN